MEQVRRSEYEGLSSVGSFHERAENMIRSLTPKLGEPTQVETGFGLGEGHYMDDHISLDLVVAVVVNGGVYAFSVEEAEILVQYFRESAVQLPHNPYASVIGPKLAKDLTECIARARAQESELRKQCTN